jgi:hypothetical protein
MLQKFSSTIRKSKNLYPIFNGIRFLLNKVKYHPLSGYQLPESIRCVQIEGYKNCFCGYYHTSPFRVEDPDVILIHANNLSPDKKYSSKMSTAVGYYHLKKKIFTEIDQTYAWNWQQGSMLQWINNNEIVYNQYLNGSKRITAKKYNLVTGNYEILPFPVQICFRDKYMLSLDYHDLSQFSEYGYANLEQIKEINGIVKYCFETRQSQQIVQKSSLRNLFTDLPFSKDHINHLFIAPGGEKFIFTYRFYIDHERFDNLFLYDLKQLRLTLLIKMQIISHCNWKNDEEIIFWGIINHQKGYYNCCIEDASIKLLINQPDDGHPSYINDEMFLTDTYPNTNWIQSLSLYSVKPMEKKVLATLPHPVVPYHSPVRCDLHPSISHDKKQFQADTRHLNYRSVIIGNINS